jgi:hypothetical protein
VPAKQQIINVLPIELATQNELSANGTDWKVQKRRSTLEGSKTAAAAAVGGREHRLKRQQRM